MVITHISQVCWLIPMGTNTLFAPIIFKNIFNQSIMCFVTYSSLEILRIFPVFTYFL